MEKYVSIRINKNQFTMNKHGGKTYKSYAQQMNHDLRNEKMDKWYLKNPNAENEYFDNGDISEDAIMKKWNESEEDYKKRNGQKRQAKTKPIITGVITFSNSINEDILKYGKDNVINSINDFLMTKFGESLNYSVFHFDEKTFHNHFSLINHDFKTGKSFGRNFNTSNLQDQIADHLKNQIPGFEYKRGIPKDKTNAEHKTVGEYQAEKIEKLEEEVQQLKDEKEYYTQYVSEMREHIEEMYNDIYDIIEGSTSQKKWASMFNTLDKYIENENMDKLDKLYEKMKRQYGSIKKKNRNTM